MDEAELVFLNDDVGALTKAEIINMVRSGYCGWLMYECSICGKRHEVRSRIGFKHIEHASGFRCMKRCSRKCLDSEVGKRGRKRMELLKQLDTLHEIAETFKEFAADYENSEATMHCVIGYVPVSWATIVIEFKAHITEVTRIRVERWVLEVVDALKKLSDDDLRRMRFEARHIGLWHLCSVIDNRFEDWKEFLAFIDACREKIEVVPLNPIA